MNIEETKNKMEQDLLELKHKVLESEATLDMLQEIIESVERTHNYHSGLAVEGVYDTYHNPKVVASEKILVMLNDFVQGVMEEWQK